MKLGAPAARPYLVISNKRILWTYPSVKNRSPLRRYSWGIVVATLQPAQIKPCYIC